MKSNFKLRERPVMGLGRLWMGEEERALVDEVLASKELNRFYKSGEAMADRLEAELRCLMGVQYALAVTSGSGALECALGAIGVGPGDEVLVPAWSWVACFTAIVRLGAKPVLTEVDDSLCFDPAEIATKSTSRTKAAVVIHFQGVPARMDAIMHEAEQAGIKVIEDCAQSPGALYKGKRVGSWGHINTYSFQHQKTITSGEGGAVLTDDPLLFERAVRMHDLGMYRPVFAKQKVPDVPHFCGGQFRMAELTAAVALAQVRKLDRIRGHCRNLQRIFFEELGEHEGMRSRTIHDPSGDSGIEVYLFLDQSMDAAQFRQRLDELNVNTAPMTGTYCHYRKEYCAQGLAHHPDASPFRELEMPAPGYRAQDFSQTEALIANMLTLPFGTVYTEEDAQYMAQCVRRVYAEMIN